MPNPKRRMSKTRTAKRRTHYKASATPVSTCSNCGEVKLQHHVCDSCGQYNDRTMLIPKK
ncbi:MAG: 50S ribosomal protein L32 [Ignavibacteriaceae bacterium]|nr:50S ribosomal protein L32 [Ignavibacteriaceae bacterium]